MEPDGTVSEVLFRIINEQALQDLVRGHHSSDRAVRTKSKDLSRVNEAGGQNGALSVTNVVTTAVRGDYERARSNLDLPQFAGDRVSIGHCATVILSGLLSR